MKKKIVSLFLTLTMVLAMTIPVFAGSYSSDGYYEGSYYEIAETCYSDRYSCTTFCTDYAVKTGVTAYAADGDSDWDCSNPAIGASTLSKTITAFPISRITTKHYVNEHVVRTNTITP